MLLNDIYIKLVIYYLLRVLTFQLALYLLRCLRLFIKFKRDKKDTRKGKETLTFYRREVDVSNRS